MNASTEISLSEKKSALTPALTPGRGSSLSTRNDHPTSLELAQTQDTILPLLGGEGRGEGGRPLQATQNFSEHNRKQSLKHELWFFAGIILLLNLPLLNGTWASSFAFHPELVRQGEWWRVLTFPFVHVSIYHLLLDSAAFFLLYSGLREPKRFSRLALVVASALGSLLVSLFAAPMIYSVGLCGLSGVAHGLMAISALEMMQEEEDKKIFWAGAISFLFVIGKASVEAITGQVVFSQLHFGNLGTPIAVCHAGGILGALVVAQKRPTFSRRNSSGLCTSTCS